jgi:translocation and assembly module TamA
VLRGWLVVFVVVATACGAPARVRAPGADYLRAVRLEGNRAIATGQLAPALALSTSLRAGAAIDPYLLAEDARRILAAYRRRGFFWAKVTPAVVRDGHAQDAVFTIEEGRRATAQVVITGLPPEVPPAAARALVTLRDGNPFDYDIYDAAKHRLAAEVEDAGYAHVQVAATAGPDAAGVAIVHYRIAPGERCTFGAVRFTGDVAPSLVAAARARLGFATGDRYSAAALARAQADLYELGRFATVELVPQLGGGAVIDVAVELSEANRHEVHVGGGVGYDGSIGVRGRGGYSIVPARDPLLTALFDVRATLVVPLDRENELQPRLQPKVRGVAALQRLDLLRPRLRGEAAVGVDYQTLEAYTWTGEHVRLGLGSPLGTRLLQLRVGWILERLQFSPSDALDTAEAPGCPEPPDCVGPACETVAQQLGLCASQWLGGYQASLVADLRDNPIEPRRGAYLDLRATVGTRLAGSDLEYLQVTPEVRGYLSIGEVIVAARARAGAIFGEVPVTQRYYSGGTSGHRGFTARALSLRLPSPCPPDGACVVIGGAALIETGVELRRRLGAVWARPVGANLFLDGGDVTGEPAQLDPGNLYWAVGAGLWVKLIGDLKVQVGMGYRLNRTGAGDPHATDGGLDNVVLYTGFGDVY